jgi:hypothetical protein
MIKCSPIPYAFAKATHSSRWGNLWNVNIFLSIISTTYFPSGWTWSKVKDNSVHCLGLRTKFFILQVRKLHCIISNTYKVFRFKNKGIRSIKLQINKTDETLKPMDQMMHKCPWNSILLKVNEKFSQDHDN